MIDLTAADVAAATGGRLVGIEPTEVIRGPVVIDSRQAAPGTLFAALAGEHVDGHDFAAAAHAAGAVAVLVSREIADGDAVPAIVVPDVQTALGDLARHVLTTLRAAPEPPVVVGITGSVGKTTTKDLAAQVFGAAGATVASAASFNNEIGVPLTVLRADRATRYLVLEMGASGIGHLAYLTSIAPLDVAVVLAVGSAHLGEFGGVEQIAQAKSELVTGLVPGGQAVLHADDPRVAAMAGLAQRVVTFGRGAADVVGDGVEIDSLGRPSFGIVTADGRAHVALRLHGEHHVANALAAAAAAIACGLDLDSVANALAAAKALSPHRMQLIDRSDGVTILDDAYNANPDSMRAGLRALATMAAATGRRSVAVLGEMRELGPEAVAAHDAVGRLAVRLNIELLVVVGDGAAAIATGAQHEGSWGDEVAFASDLAAAKQILDERLLPGDIVLVKASNGAGLWRLADDLARPA